MSYVVESRERAHLTHKKKNLQKLSNNFNHTYKCKGNDLWGTFK
jgi:hypothetical protein